MSELRDRLDRGPVLGGFLNLASPDIAELTARAGFDCVVIDAEHGALTIADVASLTRAATAGGVPAVIRVPDDGRRLAKSALDCGVEGVQFASVESGEQAGGDVAAVRYPPHGNRGVSFYTRAGAYTTGDRDAALEAGRRGPVVIAQIESVAGLAAADEIAAVEGVDVLFFGPTDYGTDAAHRVDAPSVEDAAAQVVAVAREHRLKAGTFVSDGAGARQRIVEGFTFVTVGVTPLIAQALKGFVAEAPE